MEEVCLGLAKGGSAIHQQAGVWNYRGSGQRPQPQRPALIGRNWLRKKKCLNQDQRAVWILGFGPSVLPERGDGAQEEGWMGARNCLKKERPCTHWPHGKLSFRKSAWSLIL